MASFEEIDGARKRLGLRESASLQEIRNTYRKRAHRYHPDKDRERADNGEEMKELNHSYELLMDYCSRYRYTFGREDVARAYPEEEYHRKYTYYGWFHDA